MTDPDVQRGPREATTEDRAQEVAELITSPPPHTTVSQEGDTLIVVHAWWRPVHLFLVAAGVAWFAMTGFISLLLLRTPVMDSQGNPQDFPWFMFVFLAFSTLPFFVFARMWFNHTTIRVSRSAFTITEGPLPWSRSRAVPAGDLAQVHVEQRSKTKDGLTHVWYRVVATCWNHEPVELLGGLESAQEAHWFENIVEKHLDIADHAMPGEHPVATR